MTPVFKQWMAAATTAEQEQLAREAGTSRKYLYQLAAGARNASADMAARLEQASIGLSRTSKGRLPKLSRTNLCAACAQCPFAGGCARGTDNIKE